MFLTVYRNLVCNVPAKIKLKNMEVFSLVVVFFYYKINTFYNNFSVENYALRTLYEVVNTGTISVVPEKERVYHGTLGPRSKEKSLGKKVAALQQVDVFKRE